MPIKKIKQKAPVALPYMHGRLGRAVRDFIAKRPPEEQGFSRTPPIPRTPREDPTLSGSKDTLHGHFWYNIDRAESHDVSSDAQYHIEHVVKNPKKFGFADTTEMQQYAGHPIEKLMNQDQDVDYSLEHEVMNRGWARGYHSPQEGPHGEFYEGDTRVDVSSTERMNAFLRQALPQLKKSAPDGNINVSIGHRGLGKSPRYVDFSNTKEVEQHLAKLDGASTSSKPSQPKVTAPAEPPRPRIADRTDIKNKLKKAYPSYSNTQLEREVEKITGVIGDSVEHPRSFQSFFTEILKRGFNK